MDPFQKLPPEICVEIILLLGHKQVILSLVKASPNMLLKYLANKAFITKTLLAVDLDADLVQDCMCILLFPRRPAPRRNSFDNYSPHRRLQESDTSPESPRAHTERVRRHLVSWSAQQLPDPIQTRDGELLHKLYWLYQSLLLLIEDYLTKSTSVFPPREYLCLPGGPSNSNLTFKGQNVTARQNMSRLNRAEKRRLFWAFLRYEIICKVQMYEDSIAWPSETPCYMNRGKKFRASEQEAIQCVRSYVVSLYVALYAHVGDHSLPRLYNSSSHQFLGPRIVDDLYMCPHTYMSSIDHSMYAECVIYRLADFGFDLALVLMQAAALGLRGQRLLVARFQGFSLERKIYSWDTEHLMKLGEGTRSRWHQFDEKGPAYYKMLYSGIVGSNDEHREVYRQRAWVFFDDDRVYPTTTPLPCFPTRLQFWAYPEGYGAEDSDDDEDWHTQGQNSSGRTKGFQRLEEWQEEGPENLSRALINLGGESPGQRQREQTASRIVHLAKLIPVSLGDSFVDVTPFWRWF